MRLGIIKRITDSWASTLATADLQLVDSYLDDPGKFLFFQMDLIDQMHAVSVARTVMTEAQPTDENYELLVKAALLHDIGKIQGDFNLATRIFVGVIRRAFPLIRDKLAKPQPQTFWDRIRYSCYVDLVHPGRGAQMAKVLGIESFVVELIRRHHDPTQANQSLYLTCLQNADNRN